MRQKRAKAYRKLMALYSLSFGFRQPYQILIDSEFCKAAVVLKIDISKQLGVVLQGLVKPMITQCCIHELYLLGSHHQDAVDLAKTFERRKCNHRDAISGDECISSVVGDANVHRYAIASQTQPLRTQLRSIPGVPLIHINRSVLVLEPPSDATIRQKNSTEEQGLHPSAPDRALIAATKPIDEPVKRKRKVPKGPNPLSVKKKKPNLAASDARKGDQKVQRVAVARVTLNVKIGTKRRREEDNDLSDKEAEGHLGAQTTTGTSAAARRRKRRRKADQSKAPP